MSNKIDFYHFEDDRCPVEEYLDALTDKQVEKVFFVLELIETMPIVPTKFFKKLKGTDGIWEVRVRLANNIFRLLGFIDGNDLVILNHAFTKKSQKTPRKEIGIAEQRKRDYFLNKRSL